MAPNANPPTSAPTTARPIMSPTDMNGSTPVTSALNRASASASSAPNATTSATVTSTTIATRSGLTLRPRDIVRVPRRIQPATRSGARTITSCP
ncbi:Uncharacterised protein [Mycobacteroides abscessus subsp. abscessus]|nr:Uncharacterised protein [Mycobacteroides abscessus subsp. abscessus]